MNQETYRKERSRQGRFHLVITVIILSVVFLACAGLLTWQVFCHNVRPSVAIELGGQVSARDFLLWPWNFEVSFQTDLPQACITKAGNYPVVLRYLGRTYQSVLQVRDTTAPTGTVQDLTVYSSQSVQPEDFIISVEDKSPVSVSFLEAPDMTRAGAQALTILLTDEAGNTATLPARLTVIVDHEAPTIEGAADAVWYMGQPLDLLDGVTVADDQDPAPVLTLDRSGLDTSKEGRYQITYTATDAAGNRATQTVVITVVEDRTAPQLFGVRNLTVYAGGTIAYRSNVTVSDDKDPDPVLKVDASKVNLMVPGDYTAVYRAIDAAGNETLRQITVTVAQRPDNYIEESVIISAADGELAKIITDGMTNREKVEAVYNWTLEHCAYGSMEHTDWMQAAYSMMDQGIGDCFGYYAVCRLFFERLGLPNYTIQRDPASVRPTTHFWSLVSLDGGKTYYHFDSSPHIPPIMNTCLITDAQCEEFNAMRPGYYDYDKSQYPATPEEPCQ